MPTLNVSVINKIATGDRQIIVCDNTDYVVKFTLDDEWNDYEAKTMRVLYPNNDYADIFFTGDEAPLPRLYNVTSIRIGIYAGDLHATAAALYECRKSVLSEEGQHVDPPEDVYNQILDAIDAGMVKGIGIEDIARISREGLVDTYKITYSDDTYTTFEVTNGNGIASVAKTGTSGAVDTYTITFDNGNTSSFTVTNGSVTSVNGETGDVVLEEVPLAQNISATIYNVDKEPYGYRTTGGTMDVGEREAKIQLTGGTVAWNQLVKNGNFESTSNWSALRGTISASNNVLSYTIGSDIQDSTASNVAAQGNFYTTPQHVYLVSADFKFAHDVGTNYIRFLGGTEEAFNLGAVTGGSWKHQSLVFKVNNANHNLIRVLGRNPVTSGYSEGDIDQIRNVQIIDLTQLFGSTIADYIYTLETNTAGAGVRWFRKLFPNDYYAYNAGELMSVKTSSHKTVGFNQFNGTVNRGYRWNNGSYVQNSSNNWAAAEALIKCLPNTTYCLSLPHETASIALYLQEFDSSGTWIRQRSYLMIPTANRLRTFDTAEDAHYVAFCFYRDTTMQAAEFDEMNFNLSWSGYRNGEYEPYESHSYAFDSDLELRGIPKLDSANRLYYDGDTYVADGTVTRRYGIVDLGTLTWQKPTQTEYMSFYCNDLQGIVVPATETATDSWWRSRCSKYSSEKPTTTSDNYIYVNNSGQLRIKDTGNASKTAAQFTALMSGVYFVYELVTPTTESADAYTETQLCEDYGTEEFIDSRTVAIPVGHITHYPPNLRDKLQHLPNLAEDGVSYLIRQENDYMHLEVYENPLPTAPSEDGTYTLKCTVASGVATYSWVADET